MNEDAPHSEVIVTSRVSQRKTNGTHHLCVELKKNYK